MFTPHTTMVKQSSVGMAVTVVHTPGGGNVVVGRTVAVPLVVVKGRMVTMVPLLMNIWHPKRQRIKLLIWMLKVLFAVVVGRTVTVLGGAIVVVGGKVVVGRTVTVLEGEDMLVVVVLVTVDSVVVLVRVFVLVRVKVVRVVVKKSVEKDEWLVVRVEVGETLEDPKERVSVQPLLLLDSHGSGEESEGEGEELLRGHGRGGRSREQEEGSLGSHLEGSPLNQLRSLGPGAGSSSS